MAKIINKLEIEIKEADRRTVEHLKDFVESGKISDLHKSIYVLGHRAAYVEVLLHIPESVESEEWEY